MIRASSEHKPLSDFGVIEGEGHVAVPGQSKLVGVLQRRRGRSGGT